MRKNSVDIGSGFDGLTALIYFALIIFGWFNIFSVVYDPESGQPFLDFSLNYTKQLLWIITSVLLIIVILTIDYRSYETYTFLIYGAVMISLIAVMLFGREIKGARSWIEIGGFSIQPAEFAKFATALALAKYLTYPQSRPDKLRVKLMAGLIIILPMALIVLQGDAGSALIFSAFGLVLYREGIIPNSLLIVGVSLVSLFVLTLWVSNPLYYLVIPILTIALVSILILTQRKKKAAFNVTAVLGTTVLVLLFIGSVRTIFSKLESHQKERIMVLLDPDVDPQGRGARYNLKHSLIAIGSGGLTGKGFMQGTQTKYNYVPEQSTDFIFCTIGEEHGFIGSFITIGLFMSLLYRIILIAERQRDKFVRIYGYGVASLIFFHFSVNIAMTTGLLPVIGIPLPFLSYGGSSIWSFTILLFMLLKLDAHREHQMIRE